MPQPFKPDAITHVLLERYSELTTQMYHLYQITDDEIIQNQSLRQVAGNAWNIHEQTVRVEEEIITHLLALRLGNVAFLNRLQVYWLDVVARGDVNWASGLIKNEQRSLLISLLYRFGHTQWRAEDQPLVDYLSMLRDFQ